VGSTKIISILISEEGFYRLYIYNHTNRILLYAFYISREDVARYGVLLEVSTVVTYQVSKEE
jgi:hypothetical protein